LRTGERRAIGFTVEDPREMHRRLRSGAGCHGNHGQGNHGNEPHRTAG
jgi:hypothetical protein